jgi:hypothetical protein
MLFFHHILAQTSKPTQNNNTKKSDFLDKNGYDLIVSSHTYFDRRVPGSSNQYAIIPTQT